MMRLRGWFSPSVIMPNAGKESVLEGRGLGGVFGVMVTGKGGFDLLMVGRMRFCS